MPNPLVTCPHCRGEYPSNLIKKHNKSCMANPEIRNRLFEAVLDASTATHCISSTEYQELSRTLNLPSLYTIQRVWGTWLNFVEAIGLAQNRPEIDPKLVRAELRRLSVTYHDGIIGPAPKELFLYGEIPNTSSGIIQLYGTWDAALADAGLVRETHGYYKNKFRERSQEWQAITKRKNQIDTGKSDHAQSFAAEFPLSAIDRGIRTWFDCITHTQVTAHVLELR